ncbi:unnamed protein product [Closterium sp. Yama58-4]|nr:unnamed protein product [Closterium sp. Yama58-4]
MAVYAASTQPPPAINQHGTNTSHSTLPAHFLRSRSPHDPLGCGQPIMVARTQLACGRHATTALPCTRVWFAMRRGASAPCRLGLVATIRDRANEIFKKVHDLKSIRGRSNEATYAACLYIACRQEDKPRTFKEIGSAGNNISKKEIGRATKFIVKQLEADMGAVDMGAVNAGDFMRRFCSHLGMKGAPVQAAIEVVQNTEQIDIRTSRAPISKAAAAIYMVTQLCSNPVPTKDISRATGVAEGTIRNTYKDLLPFASRLLPESYAKPEDIAKLSPS